MALARGLAGLLVPAALLAVAAPAFRLTSADVTPAGMLAAGVTCDGAGRSPALAWAGAPAGTRSYAVLGWDQAPGGLSATWVAYDIPGGSHSLAGGVPAGNPGRGITQGRASSGRVAYDPPCPARGRGHQYYFDLYALDVPSLGLPPGAGLEVVHAAIKKHRLAEAKLAASYRR